MVIKIQLKSLIAVFVLSTVSCGLVPTDGIYLLPEGFTGGVVVVFDQPDGIKLDIERGRYVYPIPENGILRVENAPPKGIINRDYYFVASDGKRSKIDYLQITGDSSVEGMPQNKFGNITQDQHDNKVYVMNAGGIGSFNSPRGTVRFTGFIVSSPKNSSEAYMMKEDKIFKIQREMNKN